MLHEVTDFHHLPRNIIVIDDVLDSVEQNDLWPVDHDPIFGRVYAGP